MTGYLNTPEDALMPHRYPSVRMLPEDRYRSDPHFKSMVDALESYLHAAEVTPTEIREAAMLAAIHYEMRRSDLRFEIVAGSIVRPAIHPGEPPDELVFDGCRYLRDGEGTKKGGR